MARRQHQNGIVFLSAFEFHFPLPFASVHTVSVGEWSLMVWVCVCVCMWWGLGWGAHVHPCAYVCLLLSSWWFFIKVLLGLTRVSSNSKLSATLILSTAGTRAAVSMIRNRYNTIHLAAMVSFLSTIMVCQKYEQHLKVYLVCLSF